MPLRLEEWENKSDLKTIEKNIGFCIGFSKSSIDLKKIDVEKDKISFHHPTLIDLWILVLTTKFSQVKGSTMCIIFLECQLKWQLPFR